MQLTHHIPHRWRMGRNDIKRRFNQLWPYPLFSNGVEQASHFFIQPLICVDGKCFLNFLSLSCFFPVKVNLKYFLKRLLFDSPMANFRLQARRQLHSPHVNNCLYNFWLERQRGLVLKPNRAPSGVITGDLHSALWVTKCLLPVYLCTSLSQHLFPENLCRPFKSWDSVKPPLFENLVGGSTPPAERVRGSHWPYVFISTQWTGKHRTSK